MKDLNDIYYFVKIVEHGGVSAASAALGISKSVLSQHLAKLETELGMCLMYRTTRQLQITDIGQRYYARCCVALAELDRAAEVIEDMREVPRGKVRITSPLNFAQMMLAPVLASFMATYPEVEITLDITNEDIDLIASGYDLALQIVPSIRASSMVSRSFALNEHILVAAASLLERYGTPATPADLKEFPTLAGALPPEQGGRHMWHLTGPDGTCQAIQHSPRLLTQDLWVLREAAFAGCGVAELPPSWCRDGLRDGRLVRILPGWTLPLMKLYAMYPSRRGLTLAVRTFIDYLSSQLAPWIESALNGTLHPRWQPEPAEPDLDETDLFPAKAAPA
ncbi:MAG TPA: LysR substrate-binding domain-containing protein [Steroidobacteraceae bacterium]|nr:LysR substrate-binding domain-containing protein [Steroidobacteraceae bacterium]